MAKTRKNDSLENQKIRDIPLDSLILWTENPRDPMPGAQTNEEIIRHALDNESTWRLRRLSKEMGEEFDKSELPTVVKKPGTAHYIVFDGNRRVILAMLRRDGFPLEGDQFALPSFPDDMPCNVCDEETALRHVLRKHSDTGSWSQLERDIFIHKYMGREKTVLIRMNELTGAISEYARLNQRYVEEDILNQKHQREMGLDPDKYDFGIDAGLLRELLETIEDKIEKGELSTRGKRNDPVAALPEDLLSRIRENATHHRTVTPQDRSDGSTPFAASDQDPTSQSGNGPSQDPLFPEDADEEPDTPPKRRTRQTRPASFPVFGGRLTLVPGDSNSLYRTLESLWQMYEKEKIRNGGAFPQIFRMGLRLLAETAAQELNMDLKEFVDEYATLAKKQIRDGQSGQDILTFLHNQHVKPENLTGLLQAGAHGYTSTGNKEQTMAISILLGEMLTLSRGKNTNPQ